MQIPIPGTAGLAATSAGNVPTLYEVSVEGRAGLRLPELDVPEQPLPERRLREDNGLPELSELDVVRHYLRLAQRNFGVDSGFYPLGSCTMKYNPKICEEVARLPGFADSHPLSSPEHVQGNLVVMHRMQTLLAEIGGFAGVSLQPAAGAHGELSGAAHDPRLSRRPRRASARSGSHPRYGTRHQPGVDDDGRLHRRGDPLRHARQHRRRLPCAPHAPIASPGS